MNYNAAKHEALFLSDKMAYELNLTAAHNDKPAARHDSKPNRQIAQLLFQSVPVVP